PDDPDVLNAKYSAAINLIYDGKGDQALVLATEVFESRQRRAKANPGKAEEQGQMAIAHGLVGFAKQTQKEFAAAAAEYTKALAIWEKLDPAVMKANPIFGSQLNGCRQRLAFCNQALKGKSPKSNMPPNK